MSDGAGKPGDPPFSPCLRICTLDAARAQCTACHRTVREISQWWQMTDAEKRAVLAALPERAAAGPDGPRRDG